MKESAKFDMIITLTILDTVLWFDICGYIGQWPEI